MILIILLTFTDIYTELIIWLGFRFNSFLIGLEGLLEESSGIALLSFCAPRHWMVVGGQHHAPAAFTPGKEPVPIVQEAGWASEPVWIGAENLVPAGVRSPDLPARSKSLYWLRYLGSLINNLLIKI
jgi:hypothetical protein